MPRPEIQADVQRIEEQISRQLVRSFYRPLIALSVIMAVVFWIPGLTPYPLAGFLQAIGLVLVGLAASRLANRGRPRAAAVLLVVIFLIGGIVYFFLFGWLDDQGAYVLPLMIFIAGLLAGPPLAMASMALVVCLVTLALVLPRLGVEPVSLNPDNPVMNAVVLMAIAVLIAGLISHYARLVRRSLQDRFELERRRQEAQRLESLGRLAGGVAHDFNNLLTPVMGHASLIAEDDQLDGELRRAGRQIAEAAERASALVTQLMAFGRRTSLDPVVLDLNRQVQKLKDILSRTIRKNVEQKYFLADDLARVRVDPARIDQVILNLAINASEAMPAGGQLIIETANVSLDKSQVRTLGDLPPGDYVLLSVTDTGQGMTKETLNRIYEPFFSTKQESGGTGLGLATVYGIVRQSKGAIHVYSEPGQGTIFKVYLPVAGEVPVHREESRPRPPGERAGNQRVLVVDDMDQVRQVTATMLAQRGYRVLQARDGQEARQLAVNQDPPIQLLITDLVMPGMGGIELARALRERIPDLKVVFISGYGENGLADRGKPPPEGQYLMKPFTATQLLEKVHQALDD